MGWFSKSSLPGLNKLYADLRSANGDAKVIGKIHLEWHDQHQKHPRREVEAAFNTVMNRVNQGT